ncbi:MAG: PAS domain S-box protein [Pirellulales bacterium]
MVLDVTERVVFNEALRSSEERLREAAYVAGFGVFEHEHRTDTLFWSKQLREIYGVPMDTTPSLDLYLSMVHPDDLSNVEIAVRRAHDPNGDGRFEVEHRLIRHGDGEIRWIATQAQTQFAGEGKYRHPLRTVGATLDVTEARAAAEALQTSETRYRQLVDMLPTGILVHSDNEILYGNPALLKLVGAIDSLQILHRSPYDFFHPSSHALLEDLQAEKDKQNPSPSGCEAIGLRCDGRSFPVHITSCPIEGYDQPTTLFALSDLTELERSAALLRSVLDSVDDAIFTVNGHGKLTSANRSTLRLFGYQESELLDQPVSMLLPDTKIADLSLTLADHAGANHASGLGIACDVNGTRNDGSTFPAELTITEFLRNGDRELTGVLRDITAKRQLEEQFRQAQKMEAIGRLAGGVAHDFNNLLTVINGYSSIVLTYSPIDEKARGPIEAIQDAGDRAARLTQQLLAFSRKSLVEPRLIDLNELVVESSKLLRRLISEDIAFSILVAPNPVYLVIDPGHIEQVLMNLVVNARDSMPTGGRLSIKTELVDLTNPSERLPTSLVPGWYASMVVTDSGSGMSPSVMEKIFEPFFTTKELGKGTGLGLAVVHGLVEQSGGSIAVESTVGMGTTFRILLLQPVNQNLTNHGNSVAFTTWWRNNTRNRGRRCGTHTGSSSVRNSGLHSHHRIEWQRGTSSSSIVSGHDRSGHHRCDHARNERSRIGIGSSRVPTAPSGSFI